MEKSHGQSAVVRDVVGSGQFCNEEDHRSVRCDFKGGASAIILGGMITDDPATLIDDADGGVYRELPAGPLYDDKFHSRPFLNWLAPCA